MKPRIAVTHPIHSSLLERLEQSFEVSANRTPEPWTESVRREACRDAHGIVAFMNDRIDEPFLSQCHRLEIVAGCMKGGDNIDLEACSRRGVAVSRSNDLLTEPTAELAIALLLNLARNLGAGDAHVRRGVHRGWRPDFYGKTLRGTRVGVVGTGAIGRAVGRNLIGLGAIPVGFDSAPRSMALAEAAGMRLGRPDELTELDMLVLCLPLTTGTVHWLDAARIGRLPPGALVVNVGRGSTVDESAVADALSSGWLGGYAADVFAFEDLSLERRPSEIDPRLTGSHKTFLAPHLGSAVASCRLAIEEEAVAVLEEHFFPG
jgi:phosphonate dehydrogenase